MKVVPVLGWHHWINLQGGNTADSGCQPLLGTWTEDGEERYVGSSASLVVSGQPF